MTNVGIEAEAFSFETVRPAAIDAPTWEAFQDLDFRAFRHSVPVVRRSAAAIGHLVEVGNLAAYKECYIQPENLVADGRLNPNQIITRQWVSIVRTAGKVVGHAHSADNWSFDNGASGVERQFKHMARNFRVVRLVATDPNFQGYGLGTAMLDRLAGKAWPGQHGSAYAWPDENPNINRILEHWDYFYDGGKPQSVDIFGDPDNPTNQYRYVKKRARSRVGIM